MEQSSTKLTFDLSAGCLCLDFANTVDKRLSGHPEDKLSDYEALVAFGQQTGIFSASEARKLRHEGDKKKSEAERIFQEAVAVREMIFRILWAVAAGREVDETDTAALNAALQKRNADSSLVPSRGQVAWRWVESSRGGDKLTGEILRSALQVLTSDDIQRVKRCAAEKCCWLFLDRSRGGNRRWCEMRTCGSQQKARAYYRRKKGTQRSGTASRKPAATA